MIEDLTKDCLSPGYVIGGTALIHRKYKHEKMTRDEKDDNVWSLEDDKYSLEFTFDWSIRMEGFP